MTLWKGEILAADGSSITGPIVALTGSAYRRIPGTLQTEYFAQRLMVQFGNEIRHGVEGKELKLTFADGTPARYFEDDDAAYGFLVASGFVPQQE